MEDIRGDVKGAAASEQEVADIVNAMLWLNGHNGNYVRGNNCGIDLVDRQNPNRPCIEVKHIDPKSGLIEGEYVNGAWRCARWDFQLTRSGKTDGNKAGVPVPLLRPGGILRALVECPSALIVLTHGAKNAFGDRSPIPAHDYFFCARELYDYIIAHNLYTTARPDSADRQHLKLHVSIRMARIRHLAMTERQVTDYIVAGGRYNHPPRYDLWTQFWPVLSRPYYNRYGQPYACFRGPEFARLIRGYDPENAR